MLGCLLTDPVFYSFVHCMYDEYTGWIEKKRKHACVYSNAIVVHQSINPSFFLFQMDDRIYYKYTFFISFSIFFFFFFLFFSVNRNIKNFVVISSDNNDDDFSFIADRHVSFFFIIFFLLFFIEKK